MLKGIDVSHWNGHIFWNDYATSEYSDFLIAKATQGAHFKDNTFFERCAACIQRDILFGMYHFVNKDDWREQVNNFMDTYNLATGVGAKPVLVLDVEEDGVRGMKDADLQHVIYSMVMEIHKFTGTYPLIYCSTFFRTPHFFKDISHMCGGWIARYGQGPAKREDLNITIRQFSSNGSVSGIVGNVDLNEAYLTKEAWLRLAGEK